MSLWKIFLPNTIHILTISNCLAELLGFSPSAAKVITPFAVPALLCSLWMMTSASESSVTDSPEQDMREADAKVRTIAAKDTEEKKNDATDTTVQWSIEMTHFNTENMFERLGIWYQSGLELHVQIFWVTLQSSHTERMVLLHFCCPLHVYRKNSIIYDKIGIAMRHTHLACVAHVISDPVRREGIILLSSKLFLWNHGRVQQSLLISRSFLLLFQGNQYTFQNCTCMEPVKSYSKF